MTTAMNGYKHICDCHEHVQNYVGYIENDITEVERGMPIQDLPGFFRSLRQRLEQIREATETARTMGQKMEDGLSRKNETIDELESQVGSLEEALHNAESKLAEREVPPSEPKTLMEVFAAEDSRLGA